MSTFLIKRGRFSDNINEVLALIERHWHDVEGSAADPELKIDLDIERYKELENSGNLFCMGMYDKFTLKLVGYLAFIVYAHHQHKGKNFAVTDGFFVDSEVRSRESLKTIIRMFKRSEAILQDEYGVEYISMCTNANNPIELLATILDYKHVSTEYMRKL
jgi:hypothetical protein